MVTKDCVEKIIKPDMVHPLTGAKLEKSDLIELARGGTGYSSSNEILMAKSYRPSLAINWTEAAWLKIVFQNVKINYISICNAYNE